MLTGRRNVSGRNTWKEFWTDYANAFAHPFKADGALSNFVKNTAVTGAYAEAWVGGVVRSMLPQFRVSTGAVIRSQDRDRDLARDVPQCDLIVWDPSDMPALFEQGQFALVPIFSVRAIIEVKRSISSRPKFIKQLKARRKLLWSADLMDNVLGVVVCHESPLFEEGLCGPEWIRLRKDKGFDDPAITRLLAKSKNDKGETVLGVDVPGVMAFIYFLSQVAGKGSLPTR